MPETAPSEQFDIYRESMAAAGALMLSTGISFMMRDPGLVPAIIMYCGIDLGSRHVDWRTPKNTPPEQ
jgi:hypothetical protein